MSQLQLAVTAEVSTRHLSYVETGRSRPSRELLLHLAEELEVPLRDRNQLLLAAGYAPVYSERSLDAPEMRPVTAALTMVLERSEPNPTIIVDRYWNLVLANTSALWLTTGVADHLLAPPINVARLSLHPDGLAPRVANLPEYATHLLARVRRAAMITGDPVLEELLAELNASVPHLAYEPTTGVDSSVVLPMRLHLGGDELSFFSTIATFGTAIDITVSELSIETFYPADDHTAAVLQARKLHHGQLSPQDLRQPDTANPSDPPRRKRSNRR